MKGFFAIIGLIVFVVSVAIIAPGSWKTNPPKTMEDIAKAEAKQALPKMTQMTVAKWVAKVQGCDIYEIRSDDGQSVWFTKCQFAAFGRTNK